MKLDKLAHSIFMISLFLVAACQSKPTAPSLANQVQIRLSADSSSVELHAVRPDVVDYLKSDSIGLKEWQSFFSVYPAPADPEMRDFQRPLPGSYRVRDTTIVFIPNEQFEKDSLYFVRCYSRQIMDEPSDLVMGEKLSVATEFVEFEFKR